MVLSKDLKIAICFGLIIGALFSFCSLCFATEPVDTYLVSDIAIRSNSTEFVSSSGSSIRYILLQGGYKYSIDIGSQGRFVVLSKDIPSPGVAYDFLGAQTGVFEYSAVGDTYLALSYNGSGVLPITREPLEGMSGFIDNIVYILSFDNIGSVWILVVPILAISVLFGLGIYFIKRIMNKIKRAKGGV